MNFELEICICLILFSLKAQNILGNVQGRGEVMVSY